jgi:hypothetical protein
VVKTVEVEVLVGGVIVEVVDATVVIVAKIFKLLDADALQTRIQQHW